jgi:peptidoglycan/xylan/chitin deacetylase (PgdA/CDA1 family)
MYHYVYDENDPPEKLQQKYKNYIEQKDLAEEFNYLKDEGYYFPTWDEVRAYVDGELILPDKSIVICFDDAAQDFLDYGIPVIDECQVPVTCFIVTEWSGEEKVRKYASDYVTYQSHSHDMHKGGGNIGHGGIFTALSEEDALADLQKSIEICGNGDAFAYPYGDYTDACRDYVEMAGFDCAVTTVYGKAYPGMDPMLLPRIRMNNDQTMDQFISMVAPPETEEY